MPLAARAKSHKPLALGFTLIEVLVVILIISIITATTLFTASNSNLNRRMEAAIAQLQNTLTLAQSQAILTQSVMGIYVTSHTYQVLLFTTQVDKINKQLNPSWQPIKQNSILAKQTTPSFLTLSIEASSTPLANLQSKTKSVMSIQPQALILPSGSFTPFTLTLSANKGKIVYVIKGDSSGKLITKKVGR